MTKRTNRFPPGWNEQRVEKVLRHYEGQSEGEAVAEDEAAFHMASAGIRELRQRASELVRRVGGALERLRATGDVEPARGDVDELPPPLVVASDVEKPSSVLARLREQER